jgi:hypothetical protein
VSICWRGCRRPPRSMLQTVPGRGASLPASLAHFPTTNLGLLIVLEEMPPALLKNSVAVVRKRTIPTERPPLISEVSANFLRVPRGQRDESLRPYSRLSRPEPLLLLPSSSSVVLTRLAGPRSRSTTFFFVVPGNGPGTSGSVARNSEH